MCQDHCGHGLQAEALEERWGLGKGLALYLFILSAGRNRAPALCQALGYLREQKPSLISWLGGTDSLINKYRCNGMSGGDTGFKEMKAKRLELWKRGIILGREIM